MTRLKRIIGIVLLMISLVCVLSGCVRLPRDEVEVIVMNAQKTYDRDANTTELFFLFDVFNGKDRGIKVMEVDVDLVMRDGSTQKITLVYDEPISYRTNVPAIVKCTVNGRVDEIKVLEYRFDIMDYWESYGNLIISAIIFYIVAAIIMVVLAMADMTAVLSILSALLVIFCVIFVLTAPLSASIYVIVGTLVAFAPFIVFKIMDY